jgi:hypothetical protein
MDGVLTAIDRIREGDRGDGGGAGDDGGGAGDDADGAGETDADASEPLPAGTEVDE